MNWHNAKKEHGPDWLIESDLCVAVLSKGSGIDAGAWRALAIASVLGVLVANGMCQRS